MDTVDTFVPMQKIIGQIVHDRDNQRFQIKGIDYEKGYIEVDLMEVSKKIKMSFGYFEQWIKRILE